MYNGKGAPVLKGKFMKACQKDSRSNKILHWSCFPRGHFTVTLGSKGTMWIPPPGPESPHTSGWDRNWTDFGVQQWSRHRRHWVGVLWYPACFEGMFERGWASSKMLFTLHHSLCFAVSQLTTEVLGTRGSSATNCMHQLVVLKLTSLRLLSAWGTFPYLCSRACFKWDKAITMLNE